MGAACAARRTRLRDFVAIPPLVDSLGIMVRPQVVPALRCALRGPVRRDGGVQGQQ